MRIRSKQARNLALPKIFPLPIGIAGVKIGNVEGIIVVALSTGLVKCARAKKTVIM